MGEDQAPQIRAFLAATHQIVGETKRQVQVPPIEVVHPLTPRDANKLRGIVQLFPQCARARVALTGLGSSPAANSKSDRTKIGLKVELLPLTLSAIRKYAQPCQSFFELSCGLDQCRTGRR